MAAQTTTATMGAARIKTYFFLRAADGRYLQGNLYMPTGEWQFWLRDEGDLRKAATGCHPDVASAERYRRMAEPLVGQLFLHEEVL